MFGLAEFTRASENSAKLRLNAQNLIATKLRLKNADSTKCQQLMFLVTSIPGKQKSS